MSVHGTSNKFFIFGSRLQLALKRTHSARALWSSPIGYDCIFVKREEDTGRSFPTPLGIAIRKFLDFYEVCAICTCTGTSARAYTILGPYDHSITHDLQWGAYIYEASYETNGGNKQFFTRQEADAFSISNRDILALCRSLSFVLHSIRQPVCCKACAQHLGCCSELKV